MIVDGEGLVMGRLASKISKILLSGESVTVLNAEKIIISGSKDWAYARYKQRVDRASISNPRDMGPKFPRRPDDIFRRAVRGMIPYRKPKGRIAFKALRVYVGVPRNLKPKKYQGFLKQNPKISRRVLKLVKFHNYLDQNFNWI